VAKTTSGFSRRLMLRTGGAAAGASLAGAAGLLGPSGVLASDPGTLSGIFATAFAPETDSAIYPHAVQDAQDSVETILNLAATAETLAVTHYLAAIGSYAQDNPMGLLLGEVAILAAALDSEFQHLEFINANGGKALTEQFYVRQGAYTDRAVFVQQTDDAEVIFIGAWIAATRRFAELGNPRLAATAAQVAAVEQSHKALFRLFGRPALLPNNVSLAQPILYNVSDAVPMVAPFLNGGAGMVGPVRYPGSDVVRRALGEGIVVKVPPFAGGVF
jgi:hypothetical protein